LARGAGYPDGASDADGGNVADDLTNRGPRDRERVNVNEPYEVSYRCKEWGCTPVQLRIAVDSSKSVMANTVESYLKAQGWHK